MSRCKHEWKEVAFEVFQCIKCKETKKLDVWAHDSEVIPKHLTDLKKEYVCKHCGKKFKKPGSLGAHVAFVHKKLDISKFIKKNEKTKTT
jgi:hypothetical protein